MAVPTITQEDLASFHARHFSFASLSHFEENFLGPVEDNSLEEDPEDDGLGYYEDGTKRTLTEEQIAIFRHSEIQALSRQRQSSKEERTSAPAEAIIIAEEGEVEDGEIEEESMSTPPAPPSPGQKSQIRRGKKWRKAQQAKEKGFFKQNVKPDLRKRTWDKVDKGLGSLDYDELEGAIIGPVKPTQRRKIAYDDD